MLGELVNRGLRRCCGRELVRCVDPRPSKVREFFKDGTRYNYQRDILEGAVVGCETVLDIGSGPAPFPHATSLCDLYTEDTVHRRGNIRTDNLPFVVADVHELPFEDQSFDFVYCAHVLEHVDDPISACKEIMRVGKKGYLETPNFMKDMLFCQTAKMHHLWHTVGMGRSLFFFEFTRRETRGVRNRWWNDMIFGKSHHPLQDVFMKNQDVFNTMFLWDGGFDVCVVDQYGNMTQALNHDGGDVSAS